MYTVQLDLLDIIKGQLYSKFSFGEVYCWIKGRKLRFSRALKRDFRMYFRQYTSYYENFEYGYPNSNALVIFQHKKVYKN